MIATFRWQGDPARCRVVLLSDTHGVLDPRIAALVRRADAAVHGGDIGARAVLDALEPRSGQVVAIRGNNDTPQKWRDGDHAGLATLPEAATFWLPGGCLGVVHGDRHGTGGRRHVRLRSDFPDARAVMFGHSHRLVVDRETTPWVLNPGAAGRARTYGGPSCIVLRAYAGSPWRAEVRRYPPAGGRG